MLRDLDTPIAHHGIRWKWEEPQMGCSRVTLGNYQSVSNWITPRRPVNLPVIIESEAFVSGNRGYSICTPCGYLMGSRALLLGSLVGSKSCLESLTH